MGAVVEAVGNVIESVVKNPLPIIETVALTAFGVPPIVANAAVSAANGGNVGDIAKAAVGGYAGAEVGQAAGGAAAGAGASETLSKIASSAAGTATSGLIQTGDIGKALAGGVVGGLTTGAVEAVKGAIDSTGIGKGTTTTAPTTGEMTPAGTKIPTSPYGTYTEVSPTSPYGTTGTLDQPTSAGYGGSTYAPSFFESAPGKALAKVGQGALTSSVSSSLADMFGLTPSAPSGGGGTSAPSGSTITTTGQASPGTQALAQALRVDPGATLGGGDQKAPQNVWNLASLRVKDETGS